MARRRRESTEPGLRFDDPTPIVDVGGSPVSSSYRLRALLIEAIEALFAAGRDQTALRIQKQLAQINPAEDGEEVWEVVQRGGRAFSRKVR